MAERAKKIKLLQWNLIYFSCNSDVICAGNLKSIFVVVNIAWTSSFNIDHPMTAELKTWK